MVTRDALLLTYVRAALASGSAQDVRIRSRLSIGEIAKLCSVGHSTVWRWERGQRQPQGQPALRYARVLKTLAADVDRRSEVAA